ncbi:MAG: serpin family protein [Caldilineaceae bacterium]|nr:serpin family protein [Caldilineaceae bacterium]
MNTAEPENSALERLIAANNALGFRLLTRFMAQDDGKNAFLSSLSIAIALTMAYNGADGATQQALASLLGVAELTLDEINEANAAVMSMLAELDPSVQLSIASSIWARSDESFDPDFTQRIAHYYRGETATLDFTAAGAADTINHWVSHKTQGKIADLVTPDLIQAAILILINAIHFKGIWTNQFDVERTTEKPFTLADGSQRQHPMMAQSGRYDYFENDLFQTVNLPYGDGRISMLLFLPTPTHSLDDFLRAITLESWSKWISHFAQMKGSVVLPRFKVEYGIDLFPALVEVGGDALGAVDFLGMGAGPLMISNVIHKSVIEVNEEGTEAAAATAVIMTRGLEPSFHMVLDRPFFCAIRDNERGLLLFAGVVNDPT